MRKLFLLLLLLPFQSTWAGDLDYRTTDRLIDFRLFYPYVNFDKSIGKRRQRVNAGVTINYQWYLWKHFGIAFDLTGWFIPSRLQGKKAMLYAVGPSAGLAFRAVPNSYFDPVLYVKAGSHLMDVGKAAKSQFSFPITAEVSANLWRETERFQDNALAFNAFVGGSYYMNQQDIIDPWYLAAGVAFRGSF